MKTSLLIIILLLQSCASESTLQGGRHYQAQTGTRLTDAERISMLKEHNRVRADVNLAPLKWSTELAGVARQWVEVLADGKCKLQHRFQAEEKWHKPLLGENLFMGTAGYYTPDSAVIAWEDEKRDYHSKPIDLKKISAYGHYTQIVWKSTSEVGCEKAYCHGNMIIACNYSPPGNYLGQMPY